MFIISILGKSLARAESGKKVRLGTNPSRQNLKSKFQTASTAWTDLWSII